ncbi:MAG: uridine diphosphate-N-acetylglucosamine-binding protein YvcK [bacterium]|nr:uridine diphosphate-N-acetylglucosamine-binding protein YvcK [bacterium]
MKKKIVVFGGGTGSNILLSGLKDYDYDLTAVVCVSDDGRSTGKLRKEFNMPAVGDIRNVIVSLADTDSKIKDLLSYRFDTYSDLDGHPIGNLILVAMYNLTGSLKESIEVLSKFLNIKSKVFPISEDNLTLVGETKTGRKIFGEENITMANLNFDKISYLEEPHVLNEVKDAVIDADLIIFSMGSLITSILPHLLCKELINVLDKSRAKILYCCNAMTEKGETDCFNVSDHINLLNKYLGKRKIDVVIASNTQLSDDILKKYATEFKNMVKIDKEKISCELIEDDLLTIKDNFIRHDSKKLAQIINTYLMR